jgi:cell division transport system permease protein
MLRGECSTREAIEDFVAGVNTLEGVEYIAIPPIEVVEGMQRMITHVCLGLLIFFAVLFVISVLLLNNTIRLAIYTKRYLINTFKLVGATKWYIMRPLLGSAMKQGLVSGIVAALLVCLTIYGVENFTPAGIELLPYREVAIVVGAMLALGVVITVLFSAFAVNKFVNMKSNKIYLY